MLDVQVHPQKCKFINDADVKPGEVFIVHKTLLELHGETALQHSPKQLKEVGAKMSENDNNKTALYFKTSPDLSSVWRRADNDGIFIFEWTVPLNDEQFFMFPHNEFGSRRSVRGLGCV